MPVEDTVYLFAGISQGFRAPNLSDLTRFDTARSNEFEVPSVDLDPEEYVSYEIGGRFTAGGLQLEAMAYYTDIQDQIQRLLTGEQTPDGDNIVTKANVGDGELYGFESSLRWRFSEHWEAFGHFAWLDGDISAEAQVGSPSQTDNHSRMMPTNARLGLRYQSYAPRSWWVESEVVLVDDADKLSMRDKADTERIPPGGTPGYTLWNLRGGMDLSDSFKLNASLDNLLDDNYRVHGSGQNEPGRNAILTLTYLY
jgi:hemoglobin/transferrin/lactoferrin receptor protein